MKNGIGLSLVLVAVLSCSAAPALARGGGHGGEHHGGAHHGDHYHHAHWADHNRPFSRSWYGHHRGAWGYGHGGLNGWVWGNPWSAATFGAATAWLGMDAARPIVGDETLVPTVYTSDTSDAGAPADAQAQGDAPQDTSAQAAAAAQLANTGRGDPAQHTAFLPLGVFSLAPEGQTEASALVQLAVAKDGMVRGTYYDLLSDNDQQVRGAVDKKTQHVAFSVGASGKVVFETSLANLTQRQGAIAVHYENGKTSPWTLARYAQEPTSGYDAADETHARITIRSAQRRAVERPPPRTRP